MEDPPGSGAEVKSGYARIKEKTYLIFELEKRK
jgi:hypothetical protein